MQLAQVQTGLEALPSDQSTEQVGSGLLAAFQPLLYGAAILLALWLVLLAIRRLLRRLTRRAKAFQRVLLLVTLPKESQRRGEDKGGPPSAQQIQEQIAVAEQLFSTIGGLEPEGGLRAWLLGRNDHISLEILAKDGLISFYVAPPRSLQAYVEQQIHAQYPTAQVEEVEDYNLFLPRGTTVGSYLTGTRSFIFPLRTYKQSDSDPLNAITNVVSKLAEGDAALIQLTVRSAKGSWHAYGKRVAAAMNQGKTLKEALRAHGPQALVGKVVLGLVDFVKAFLQSQAKLATPGKPEEKHQLSEMEREMAKGIEQKASKAGLDANLLLVVSAADRHQAERHLDDIINAFSQYSVYTYGNSFRRRQPRRLEGLIRQSIYRSFDESRSFLVNTEELASLYHFPLPTTETPNIRWLLARQAPAPVHMPSVGLVLGRNTYRGRETAVRLQQADRRRHVYIMGKSGVGKSVLLLNMAAQDIANGEGVCVVDPHGDLVEAVLAQVPKERAEDVILFDPSDAERPMGLNMLEADTDAEKDFAAQEMIAIFYKLVTDPSMIGPMFEHYMRNAMLTIMADAREPGTIVEIPRILTDKEYQQYKLRAVADPVIRAFWEKELPQTSGQTKGEMLPYLVSKIGRFVENQLMRNIIGQPKSGFSFREVMDQRKILLVNLAKGKIGEMNSNLLGLIVVSKLQMAAMRRAELPEEQRHDFYLYIDEFQNFITDSIATILSEARKYRLDLIIAHQYIGQLVQGNDTKIRDAVFGNAGTMAAFRIGVEDAETMAKEFAPVFNEYDLINVEQYTAYVKLLIGNASSKPFSMQTYPPQPGNLKLAAAIRQLSRLKYGRPRAIVEAEILERTRIGETASAPAKAGATL